MKLIVGTLLVLTVSLAAEKSIKMKDLPAAVQKTIQEQTKGAEVKGISKETEKGKTLYEVETVVNGKTRDMMVDASGKVTVIEQEVTLDSIPAAAKAAIEKQAAGGKITKVETLTQGDAVTYEAAVTKGSKKSEITVKADGTPVKE